MKGKFNKCTASKYTVSLEEDATNTVDGEESKQVCH